MGDCELDMEDLKPCVPMYGPMTMRNLNPGQTYLWCTCGLADKSSQPWCDQACSNTAFKPLEWTVPTNKSNQTLFSICNCKYSKNKPYCDAEHISLPLKYLAQQKACNQDHDLVDLICHHCGFQPNKTQ
ncbi:hypothetical protein BC833DRAFT_593673 [Globomyces pollinis-pini]|nr:hypothetical protein BC833DRAFT_593673 [Globomyces pollinis-pini]